eukprot:PhM_4_TR16796/c1_g1_i4/m.97709
MDDVACHVSANNNATVIPRCSIRKGSLTFLADCGVNDASLQLISGHKRKDTLDALSRLWTTEQRSTARYVEASRSRLTFYGHRNLMWATAHQLVTTRLIRGVAQLINDPRSAPLSLTTSTWPRKRTRGPTAPSCPRAVQELSAARKRGRHTSTHVTLYTYSGIFSVSSKNDRIRLKIVIYFEEIK